MEGETDPASNAREDVCSAAEERPRTEEPTSLAGSGPAARDDRGRGLPKRRLGALARRRWLIVTVSVFAIALMLTPTYLDPTHLHDGPLNLSTDVASPGTPTRSFYPYLVNTSLFPNPDVMQSPAAG